ncbi:MAG: adenosylcobinamide-GDP ribazoletransferase, partial [bacterium]|nr:adenosylcobinamide-GDP ribazoletransferase [bacterium]
IEKKLAILSDSHTGAFAVICGMILMLLNLGLWSELSLAGVEVICFGFLISRCISGWSVAALPCAKESGLAATFQSAAQKRTVKVICMIELIIAGVISCIIQWVGGVLLLLAAIICALYYAYMSKKQFGGITGDLAGWFLQTVECVMAIFVLVGDVVWF